MKTCWTFEILWFIAIEIFFCIRIFSPKSSYLTTIHFTYKRFNLCVSNAMPWLHNKAGKQTNLFGLMKRTISTKHWENSLPVSRISINYELHNNCIHLVEYVLCERANMFLRMALCHRISNTYCVAWTMMSTAMSTMNKWYQEVYVMCHVLCIPLDHYSTLYAKQKKNVRQQQNSIHFSLSLHYSWRNPHFLGWKWRWCILFCVYYRARNSFYEIQIVSISCWVCSFSHVSIQSFRVRQKKKKTYGNVSMNARQHSQMSRFDPFWWFFICKTSKCSFTFDYIVVFNMNKNSQSTFASAKMCQQEK